VAAYLFFIDRRAYLFFKKSGLDPGIFCAPVNCIF